MRFIKLTDGAMEPTDDAIELLTADVFELTDDVISSSSMVS